MVKALIVYGEKSKLPRRIVFPDSNSELLDPSQHVGLGEAFIVMDAESLGHVSNARYHIAAHHGLDHTTIPSGRCVVVDKENIVTHVLMADPEIDFHPAGRLIAHDSADIGHKLPKD